MVSAFVVGSPKPLPILTLGTPVEGATILLLGGRLPWLWWGVPPAGLLVGRGLVLGGAGLLGLAGRFGIGRLPGGLVLAKLT